MSKYLQLLRVNHWFKNLFIFAGVLLAGPSLDALSSAILAFFLASTISSVNYIVNQIADRKFDSLHPEKKHRPLPAGLISTSQAICLAGFILGISFMLAYHFYSISFIWTLITLFVAGLVYNIKPVRTKNIPYLDVVFESINNPIRFLLGWFAVGQSHWPSVTLLACTWTIGAVFMTAKRYDELVFYGKKLGPYRATFNTYTPTRLLVLMVGYSLISILLLCVIYPWAAIPVAIFLVWFVRKVKSGEARARNIEHFVLHPFANHT